MTPGTPYLYSYCVGGLLFLVGLVYAWRKGVLHWFTRPVER